MVISVMQIIPEKAVSAWADKLLALDSLAFLISTFLSYWAIRHRERSQQYEQFADRLFLLGMSIMVVISFLMAYDLFLD